MKRNFVVGMFGGLIGSAMLLLVLSAAGIVGARGAEVAQSDVSRANEVSAATPLTSTFTYQGQLKNGGSAVNGSCQMAFRLYDAASSGILIGNPITPTVPVTNGLFTVGLNFGSNGNVFDGNDRWLDIQVKCGSGGFVPLTTRQQLTAAPYAFALPGLYTQPNAISPNIIGGYSGNFISSTMAGSVIGGGGLSGLENRVQAGYATVGGGLGNTASGDSATVGGGERNTASGYGSFVGGGGYDGAHSNGNQATGNASTIGGGLANTASSNYATIAGGYLNTVTNTYGFYAATVGGGYYNTASSDSATVGGGIGNAASGEYATVGGGESNIASANSAVVGGGDSNIASGVGAFVGGGGYDGTNYYGNQATGNASTIGGGISNTASFTGTTIGGGYYNTASGAGAFVGGGGFDGTNSGGNQATGNASTIGGGISNTANGNWATVGGGFADTASGGNATVGGGWLNNASNQYATVGGGDNNTASGYAATVGGGQSNNAAGDYSFAAGHQAKANVIGTFVWADSTGANLNANTANSFLVRASGGITLYTNSGATIGAALAPGSGSWSVVSDRNLKENFTSVDSRDILARLVSIPIQTWNYTTQDASIRHIGPMAQDFRAAFGAGENDTTISTVDAQGVAFAAIQGLYQVVQEKNATIAAQQKQIDDLQTRLSKVEQNTTASNPPSQPEPFNVSTLLSVIAFAGFAIMWLQQRRSKRGEA